MKLGVINGANKKTYSSWCTQHNNSTPIRLRLIALACQEHFEFLSYIEKVGHFSNEDFNSQNNQSFRPGLISLMT